MSQESQAISHNISLLLTEGRTAEARGELERLLALDPEDPEARSQAGDVYAYTGAHSAAYKNYNLAAETYNRLGRADKALAVHHKILELDPTMLDAATQTRIRLLGLLVSAEDAIVSGQNDKAVAGYQEAIRQFPNHTITYQRLASLLVRLGRVEDAAEQYLTVARAFYAHGVLPKARPYFERVLELKPAQPEALEAVLACLKAEAKEEEGERFIKGAVQGNLKLGRADEARSAFDRLGPAASEAATPLGASVLLQGGDVSRAERMAAALDLQRPEMQGFFRDLGRAALERGDSVSADAYFRWAQGRTEIPLPGAGSLPPAPPPLPVAAVAPLPPLPVVPAAPPPPPVAAVAPPAPLLVVPPAPVAPPLPVTAVPLPLPVAVATPVASLPVAPSAPPPAAGPLLATAPMAPQSLEPQRVLPAAGVVVPEDRAVLQTMGEMCLAEEMYEEAKQVFERLTKADADNAAYWEFLNRARGGLGLSPVFAPSLPPPAPAPAPAAPPVQTTAEVATAEELHDDSPELEPIAQRSHVSSRVPVEVERPSIEWADQPYSVESAEAAASPKALAPLQPALPLEAAATPATGTEPAPVTSPGPATPAAAEVAPIPAPIAALSPPVPAAAAEAPVPAPPAPSLAPPPALKAPVPPKPAPRPIPVRAAPAAATLMATDPPPTEVYSTPDGTRIERTQYVVQLGELPPAVRSGVDDSDDIIE